MMRYYLDWNAIPVYKPEFKKSARQTKVSILVPARNEEESIETCIRALLQQDYHKSLFEIIVIDDHSDDDTANLAEAFEDPQVRVLRLADYPELAQQAFKKLALATGIKKASGNLIITTDADCYMGPSWLSLIVAYYEDHKVKMIAGPVSMVDEKSLLEKFQSLDFCGMMGITGAGVSKGYMLMGNGANIAYAKKAFEEVNGFEGIDHLASGDDMLLMQKIAAVYPGQVHYLKNANAVVYTKAQPTWSDFIQQRIRWASKSSAYPQKGVTLQLVVVYFFCWNLILNFCLIPFWELAWMLAVGQLFLKMAVDYLLLSTMTSFFSRKDLMRSFLPSQLLHILYIVGIGTLGNIVKRYSWKGRKVR
ncbi:MAG: cellulose synthase/poly-beta-1,6-N-acetylglucosamine synthase-like glycosyltransferase [Polaribacter sp.]|jgi:cellulose synthase/poly-beta-1,6-N-acetylglucosamine synthase-like glycosyltransferase